MKVFLYLVKYRKKTTAIKKTKTEETLPLAARSEGNQGFQFSPTARSQDGPNRFPNVRRGQGDLRQSNLAPKPEVVNKSD